MRRVLVSVAAAASCLLFIIIVIGPVTIVAQSTIKGEWRADGRPDRGRDTDDASRPKPWKGDRRGKISVQFERWRSNGGHNSTGMDYTLTELGLTDSQVQNGPVSFRLVREAGTVDAEGTFTDGRGKGTFTFTPNPGFLTAMKARGFDFEQPHRSIKWNKDDDSRESIDERLLSAALIGVTTAIADDINSANFGKLDVDDLFKAAIFHVDSKYMAEMKATGFPNLDFEDLVKGRIFNIDAGYVRQVHDMGFDNRDFEGLVKFRIFKITPEFLNDLKSAGLENLDSEEIVKCRIFKIDADYVRKVRAEDPHASIEDMVRMKIGVGRRHRDDGWQ